MDNNGNIETESNTSTIQPRNASHIYQEFLHCLGDVQAVAMFLLGSKWRSQKGFSCTGNWKAYFISHGVPKCAIFDAARSHLHIWLMENGSFLDVFMVIYLLIIVFSIATLNTHIVCTCVSCCMIAT